MKKNCWEHMNCGREQDGKNAAATGVCPAATDMRLNGIHAGRNAGRTCWMIAGTLCGGKIQGTFGMKYKNLRNSAIFYQNTSTEEGSDYKLSVFLLNKLKPAPAAAA